MEMNIHQALSELKLLRSRIDKAVGNVHPSPEFIGVAKTSSQEMLTPVGMDITTYTSLVQGNLQSALSLIKRYNAIKSAILLSNATTYIVINGNQMTVAEAIDQKTVIRFKKSLLATLIRERQEVQNMVTKHNHKIDSEINTEIISINQSAHSHDNVFLTEYRETQEKLRQLRIIDGIEIDHQIQALEDEISAFEKEINHVLSTSNALTRITISE